MAMEHQVKQSECVCMNMKRMVQLKLAYNIFLKYFFGGLALIKSMFEWNKQTKSTHTEGFEYGH
jgi:hypothetical protein